MDRLARDLVFLGFPWFAEAVNRVWPVVGFPMLYILFGLKVEMCLMAVFGCPEVTLCIGV